jgi:hypothetical protein
VEDGAEAKVVLVEVDQEHHVPGSIRATSCDNDGRFNIDGLRPTSYYVFAFKIVELGSAVGARFVSPAFQGWERAKFSFLVPEGLPKRVAISEHVHGAAT